MERPAPARIFGSLPVTDFGRITIPGLAADLNAVHVAWQDGSLGRTRSWIETMRLRLIGGGVALVVVGGVVVWRRRDRRSDRGSDCGGCNSLAGLRLPIVRENTPWRPEEGYKEVHQESLSSKKSSSSRKYSPSAGKDVEREMKAMKQGKLKSGRSGKKVTSRKQAIAIGLSEARKEGKKVPAKKK